MMSGSNLEASPCKMTEPFNFEEHESKLPPHDSLRSLGRHNHPNFRLKSPESGNKKNIFLLCEQTKEYLASQEDSSGVSSSPAVVSEDVAGFKGDRALPTGNSVSPLHLGNNSATKEVKTKPSNNVSPTKSKKSNRLIGNALSIKSTTLFKSLGQPLRPRTCQCCGMSGSLRCSRCKQIYYCSALCQKRDWVHHSVFCRPFQQSLHRLKDNKSPFETENIEVKNESDDPLGDTKETATSSEKIMFSDLRSLQLKKTMEIQGMVTEFKHPGNFYVQLNSSEVLKYMKQLSKSLKETYGNMVHEGDYVPAKGEVCAAKDSVAQTWKRAIIQDVDVLQKKAQVLYIDYGNEEIIPVDRIYQLHRSINLFPPCAIKCLVAGVVPAKGDWSSDCITTVRSLLMEQHCSVKIIDTLEEEVVACAVDVVLQSSGKLLDHMLVEMGYGVKSDGQNSKEPSVEEMGYDVKSDGQNSKEPSVEEMGYGVKSDEQNSKEPTVDQSEYAGDPKAIEKMTAENRIVINRSALIPRRLPLNAGDEFWGLVAHIHTPEHFFCQKVQSGDKLKELQASLSEYCSQVTPRLDFYPAIGDMCCAQFSEDNQWYRASVLAYASEESVLVGYVDYGNIEILSLTRLCPIIPKLLELPIQALECVLAGVKPSLGIWTPEAVCLMKKTTENKMVLVKVVDRLENGSLVELMDKSRVPNVNIANILIDAGVAMEKKVVTDKTSDMKKVIIPLDIEESMEPLEWTWVEPAVDETVDVSVCVMYSPEDFYCHVVKEDSLMKLKDLNKSLTEYCQQKLPNGFKVELGQPCCAFFAGDQNWYRALVKEILPSGNVKVQFVDYGNIEEVTIDKLRMISSTFLKLPFQGIQCWLVDIQPIDKHWTTEAIKRFHTCVLGIKLQARVVEISEKGLGIELTDLSTPYPKIISDVLFSEHLVLKSSSPYKHLPKSRPVNTFKQCETQELQATPLAEQWKTVELPVNKTVQASILEIVKPTLFYAILSEMPENEDKWYVLTAKLIKYCSAQKVDMSYRPRIGDACCAKYTSDDFWYRAIVLGTSDSEVRVLYADYGNIETLPLSRVQPITASHLELPFLIIKCSLEGLTELNGSCSQLVMEPLKQFMLNQKVMLSVKGVTKNVHIVSVEKCSENGTVRIADELVKYGLGNHMTPKRKNSSIKERIHNKECCCKELQKQVEKHEKILLFLLNNPINQNKFIEMKNLLKS